MNATHATRSKLPTAPCGHCQAPVPIEKHRRPAFDRGEPVYCNREHRMAAVGRQVEVTCALPECGITFKKHAADVERTTTGRFFCTREHAKKGAPKPRRGVEVPCGACGQPVYLKPSEAEQDMDRYCDAYCKAVGQRGERVERVERECEHCGETWHLTPDQKAHGVRFCKPECAMAARRRKPGDRRIDGDGYAWLTLEDGSERAEHRHVMEKHLGRPLLPGETVHHKKGGFEGRSNNDLSNLELWTGNHPKGHRVEDVVSYCREMLALYGTPDERAAYVEHLPAEVAA